MAGPAGILVLGMGAFTAVALLVPVVRAVAIAYGITDQPASHKLHRTPTPYLGGVALIVTSIGAAAFLPSWVGDAGVVLLGAVLVGLVGLVDDMQPLQPRPRLAAEALAALLAASAGARVDLLGGPWDWVLTVAWLVLITNAFNLLDNMDGAAGIVASVTAVCITIAAAAEGQWLVGGFGAVIAGSSVGFLVYNWHPAKIFLGDSGSLFLGFLLAVAALKLHFPVTHVASISAVLLLMGVALFDTTLVVVSRRRGHRPIMDGGTDHTAHRLLRLGLDVPTVAMILAVTAAGLGALGILIGRAVVSPWAVMPVVSLGGLLLVVFLRAEARTGEPAHTSPDGVVAVASVQS